ncbi:MAG: hypothetical protein WC635_14370 [Bacteriovorax sp.]|jgi:hypothetical protein
MKKLLALTLFSLSFALSASIITFECKSPEVAGVHKFDARGIVSVDEYNVVDGVVSLQVQKAQAEGSAQVFEEIKVNGTRQHFEAGQMSSNAFEQLTLTTKESYIKTLNLMIDFKVEISSQVSSVDNFLYRSNCYVVGGSNHDKE